MWNKGKLKNKLFIRVKNIFTDISPDIRNIALSMFLYIFWRWLGWDTFFSLYIDDIVNNVFRISIISAILSLSKMFFSITVGEQNDNTDIRSVILFNKIIYVGVGILYFVAWLSGSLGVLIAAVLINGVASAWMTTSYQTFIRKNTKNWERGKAFALYYVAINMSLMIGALVAALFIKHIDIHYTYLFIPLFAVLSLFIDKKLPKINKRQRRKTFWQEKFLSRYLKNIFSFRPIKKVALTLKNYSSRMYYALWFEMIFGMLNYIGFIFVPIVSIANNLSLTQVAIVFAVMKFPYIIDLFVNNFAATKSKRIILFTILLFMSFFYFMLGLNESFRTILIITFGISFGLALMRPVISAYISDCTNSSEEWTISWVAEFIGKAGEIIWVLLFGGLSMAFGVQGSFVFVGILVFIVSLWGLAKGYRFYSQKIKSSKMVEQELNEQLPMTSTTQM